MEQGVRKYGISIPDKQLACVPLDSKEADRYLKAMACAANYAWTNRQFIVHWVREAFERTMGQSAEDMDMHIVYDVAHNIAKIEEHEVDGQRKKLCVHRKGATRAFGPGLSEVPQRYQDIGQPVLIPGDMGTASYVLVGTEKAMKESYGSTCHGAGRIMSRSEAKRRWQGDKVVGDLQRRNIYVKAQSLKVVAEEAPMAYKEVDDVVRVVHGAGISRKVVRLTPLGVVKG
jgi:tRNA-splicing ligase RtcB